MSLPFSPYLSQILPKLLETLTSPQRIKISIHLCNLHEVILLLFGTINFTTKNRSQPVWTSFFLVVDRLGPVFKGTVGVPEYLERSRPVAVASCLVLREKKLDLTGLENTICAFVCCVKSWNMHPHLIHHEQQDSIVYIFLIQNFKKTQKSSHLLFHHQEWHWYACNMVDHDVSLKHKTKKGCRIC